MSQKRDVKVAKEKSLSAYQRVAEAAFTFSDPVRLEIIEALAQSARTVESLAAICGLPVKNISHHLQKLRVAGLVDRVKLGRRSIYSLASQEVAGFWSTLRSFAEAFPPGASDHGAGDSRMGMSIEDLAQLVTEERVTVIDVRPTQEFESGHLSGALSMPIDELPERLSELPRTRPVVAFCRGPYCLLADRAVDLLRRSNFEALRCADGIIEWRSASLPLQE